MLEIYERACFTLDVRSEKMIGFHILTENRVRKRGLLAEHGLSLWIESGRDKILFDTGQSEAFIHNAAVMGIRLEDADRIIFSHGHYDHTGGFKELRKKIPVQAKIHLHPEAFRKRYVIRDEKTEPVEIGITWDFDSLGVAKDETVYNSKPVLIRDGILISGAIPRKTDFEEVPACFEVESSAGMVHDLIIDEQMLIIKGEQGIYLFLGCGHPGVANCLHYAAELFPGEKIAALIGGMHLEGVETSRLNKTIRTLFDLGVRKVIPLHCTGATAVDEMKKLFGESCLTPMVGDLIELE